MSKKDWFVKAYCWMFGSTKKKALEVYKASDPSCIDTIVDTFRDNAKKAFYED